MLIPELNGDLSSDTESDDSFISELLSKHWDPDEYFARNAFRIVYQTNNFFLPQIRDLIDKGEVLNLRPAYQRRLRWNSAQKSRLIESLLLNIPIPPVFLFETDAARYEVMDGQQRMNAVREFIDGAYALSGLSVLVPLNGLRYATCPPRIRRAFDRASLSAIVLLLESSPASESSAGLTLFDIRRFIFDRLNTGGTKLNQQEIRNALYPGAFSKILVKSSRLPVFTETFEIPPHSDAKDSENYESEQRKSNSLYSSMGDCQLVLRYFSLIHDDNIRGSIRSILDRTMQHHREISEDVVPFFVDDFKQKLEFLYHLFDGRPFRLPASDNEKGRISAVLYDSLMVALNRLWDRRANIQTDKAGVQLRMDEALRNERLQSIIVGQGNTAKAIKDRIAIMIAVLLPDAAET